MIPRVTRGRGGGTELGYAEITASATSVSATLADVTGLSVGPVSVSRPVKIMFDSAALTNSDATAGCHVAILRGSTVLKRGYVTNIDAANTGAAVHIEVRDTTTGSNTYKIQFARSGAAGTATLGADDGTVLGPAFIQVIEV